MVEDWKRNVFPGSEWPDDARRLQSSLDTLKFHDPFAELRKSIEALRPPDFSDEIRKWMTPAHDYAAEARKLLDSFQTPSFTDQFRNLESIVGKSATMDLQSALLGRTETLFGEWRRSLDSITREQTLGIADLLAVSTQTYRSIFGESASLVAAIGRVAPSFWSAEVDDPERFLELIEDATETVRSDLGNSRLDALSLEFYLSFLIALLLFVWQLKLSDESERRVTARIAAVETALTDRIEARQTFQQVGSFAFARRSVDIKEGPRSRSKRVVTLYPNTPVRVVTIKREWVRVEFFDHTEGLHRAGWCRKKYLDLPSGVRSYVETEHLLSTRANADRLKSTLERARNRSLSPRSVDSLTKELFGGEK